MPIVCAALDYQGGDSGQITSGCWGGGEMVSGSCSPYKNRKLVFKFQVLFVFKWVLLALQEQKTCSQVSGFICLQVFCSKKGGQNNKENGPRRESEKG